MAKEPDTKTEEMPVKPFLLEALYYPRDARTLTKGGNISQSASTRLVNSTHIVALRGNKDGITTIFRSKGDALYVPLQRDTLAEEFKKRGYDIVTLDDQKVINQSAPKP